MTLSKHNYAVPSLAKVRPFLSPRPLAWVESILAGIPQAEYMRQNELQNTHSITVSARYVAEAAGLEIGTGGFIREAVLRMRIAELEGR